MREAGSEAAQWPAWRVLLVLSGALLPLMFAFAVTKKFSHDEHQHVAAGMLLAREGLLPYRDFPHFHTPYLVFIYGALFRWTEHPLLVARTFSALCATGVVALVGTIAFGLFRPRGLRFGWWAAAGAALLCLSCAVFTYTTGRAWNQEPCLLFTLLAFLAAVHALKTGRAVWLGASGLLLALAIGVRITVAPLVAPFAAMVFFGEPFRWKLRPLLWLAGGLTLGGSGMLATFAVAPEGFLFGNFEFAQANIAYRYGTGEPRTMTVAKKLRFVWKEIVRSDFPLLLAALIPWIATWRQARRAQAPLRIELRFILLLLPFLLLGALAPSPSFEQYFYPFVPFLALGAAYSLAALPPGTRATRKIWGLAAACLAGALIWRADKYDDTRRVRLPHRWKTSAMHAEGAAIRKLVPAGRILTLGPIAPLEAGLSIYPAFGTGFVAWRTAPFIEHKKAARLHIVSPAALDEYLAHAPPAGVLVGLEDEGEEPLIEYARAHSFQPVELGDEQVLWIPGG